MSDSVFRSHRVFTPAFKEAAMVRLDAGEALAAVARDLELSRKVLYDWRAAFRAEGADGFRHRRGPKPGWRERRKEPPPDVPPGLAASPAEAQLAWAEARIAELERLAGRQQLGLDFFRKALQILNAAPDVPPSAPGSTPPSKP